VSAPGADWAPFEVMLCVNDGWICCLEYVNYTGMPPTEFPPAGAFGVPFAPPAPRWDHHTDA
jgi:hypothetical protein